MRPGPRLDRPSAENLAVAGLTYLSASPNRLGRFLEVSGLEPETVREAAETPGFLSGLLDYIAADEELLISFAAELGVKPDRIMQAREVLSPTDVLD
jgi:hypothetical protein